MLTSVSQTVLLCNLCPETTVAVEMKNVKQSITRFL